MTDVSNLTVGSLAVSEGLYMEAVVREEGQEWTEI